MLFCFSWPCSPALSAGEIQGFGALRARLIRDGYDTAWIQKLYADSRVQFLPDIARLNVRYVEDTAVYLSFSEEPSIGIAREYFLRQKSVLDAHERKSGVPARIVVAILLIESKCGRDKDKAPALGVLSTIAASASASAVKKSFEDLKARHPDLTLEDVRRRARKRGLWAYRELRTLLNWMRHRNPEEILSLRGSWAGALGLPQFMPSALAAYGVDGDADGRVDLFDDDDAIASVCHYLRQNGWKPGRPPGVQRRVILRYNKSGLYADAVLRVADRLSDF